MRVLKIILALVLCGVVILSLSCGSKPESATSKNQIITVERGDLTIDITAVGNLALSVKEDLAFEISGTAQDPLTVEEILVEEGDSVKKGQVIARLDTTTLEDAIETQEEAVKKAEDAVYTAELSVRTAKINLETAEDDYREIIYPLDYYTFNLRVPEAISSITGAEQQMKDALKMLESYPTQEQYLEIKEKVIQAREDLEDAGENLNTGTWKEFIEVKTRIISGVEVETEYLPSSFWGQITAAQTKIDSAQISLDRVTKDVEQANSDLDKARDDLNEAKEKLDKAVIVAPFDGFITTVNVAGGDEVSRGTVAVQLADPNKFEADVLVSEMDIFQVKVGGGATVQVDALQDLALPAEVTHIAPTATISSGVVNYQVRVEVKSLDAVMQERQEARQEAVQNIAQGELPERLKQAIAEGRLTQEQAEEMMKQGQQATQAPQGQVSLPQPQDIQLKEGLTVTVSIIVDEANDVLLVPNGAITTRGMQSYVRVVSADGTTEERAIQTGITDYQYIEVTGGLSDGEQVIVPQGTATTTTTTSTQQNQERGIMIPGMGGPPR